MVKVVSSVKTYQAIVVLNGAKPAELVKELTMAGMTVLNQYNPMSSAFVGEYEAKQFNKHWESWLKDNNTEQVYFTAPDMDTLVEIEYKATLESVPLSVFGNGEQVLVLGPFTKDRLDYLLQNCTKQE